MKTIIAAFANDEAARQAADELRASDRRLDIESLKLFDAGDRLSPGKLTDRGVSEDRAQMYSEAVRRGAALLILDAEDNDANEIASLLDRRGSLDLDTAAQRWRGAGWTGYQEEGQPYDQNAMLAERAEFQRELPVIEEEVKIGKREVEREGVRLRSFVTERPIQQQVELREEHVEVHRERVDEPIHPSEAAFTEDEFTVTTKGEEPVVEKQARVVERVGVEKTAETRTENIEETERRQDVEVEKLEPGTRRP
jgi:stress response protein YsnF